MTKGSTPQLERVLSLRDLVLFNLVAVIGITWVATAAKADPSFLVHCRKPRRADEASLLVPGG